MAQDAKTVGFDGDYFTYNDFNTLQELLCGKELKVIDLKYIRMVKDKRELELMWRAVKIADEAYLRLLDELQPGMTEKTLAGRLEYYMRSLGAEKLAFETIVARVNVLRCRMVSLPIKKWRSATLLLLISVPFMTAIILI